MKRETERRNYCDRRENKKQRVLSNGGGKHRKSSSLGSMITERGSVDDLQFFRRKDRIIKQLYTLRKV